MRVSKGARGPREFGLKSANYFWAIVSLGILLAQNIRAESETVKFSEDELAAESVLPVFDEKMAVRRRTVVTEERFELGGFGGVNLNEPFFDYTTFGGSATYHFSEIHGAQLFFLSLNAKPNQFSEKLDSPTFAPNLKLVPTPKMLIMGAYEFAPYYGKISITNQMVANLTTYFTAGLGTMTVGDGSAIALSAGLGQKYYFGANWGLGADIRGLFFNGPDPLSISLANKTESPPLSEFGTKFTFNFTMNLGVFILL